MAEAHIKVALRLAIIVACCSSAFALDPALDVSQYAHTTWRVRDGFVKGAISSLAQTPDGYVWLGTELGLLRFDGVRAVQWQPPAGQKLPGSLITSLLAARDGTLWIGTMKGLANWNDGKLRQVPELTGRSITSLLEGHDGTVWIGTYGDSGGTLCDVRSGVAQCDRNRDMFGTGVKAIYEDSNGTIWLGMQNGLWRWRPGTPEFFSVPDEPFGIISFAEDEQGQLLFGSHVGIRRFVDGRVEPYPSSGSAYPWQVTRMFRDHEGGLWVGTSEHGVVHIHEQGRTDVFSQADGLSGDYVTRLLEDREGSIWVATYDGVDRFRGFAVPTISFKQGLSNTVAWSVLASKDGSVWIGTSHALNRWKNGQISLFGSRGERQKSDGKLNGRSPESLFQDSSGRIWISTDAEFGYLQDERFIPIRELPGGIVHSITEVPSGHLWVANQQAGLFHVSQGLVLQQIPWAGLGRKDFANVLIADPSQRGFWLGFNQGGVAYFADGTIRASYSGENGLGEGHVTDLRFGAGGALWAATETGLSRIKDGHVITLTSQNGLPCDKVVAAIEDNDHSMWLYMACGLVRITQAELDAWVGDPSRVLKVKLFDTSDGVRSHAAAGGFPQLMTKSADGRIWFFTWDGVSIIDPHHLVLNKLPPPVHIEQIVGDRKIYDTTSYNGTPRLPPLIRDLEIDYTALSLVAPEKIRFRYKLEGRDRDWQDAGNRRQAFYTDLPPRHYRFRVAACNNSGVWNEAGTFLDFSIAPAYYQTNWFRALCVAAFLALLWALYRLRVQQLRNEERKFREAVEAMPALAFVSLPDGSRTFVNKGWIEYTGLAVEQAAGSGWQAATHPDDLNRVLAKWRASLASGDPLEYETRLRRGADGEYRWFLTRAAPIRDKRGKIVKWCGTATDIEDRKRAEELQAELAHINRVTTMGELTASLAHEIKQPIGAAVTNAEVCLRLLNRNQPDVPDAREAALEMVKDARRAGDIIDRVRSLYQKGGSKPEAVDVNEIIAEMLILLRNEANRHSVNMRADLAEGLPQVTADRVQLQQVLMNLMLNGIEAMRDSGGELIIQSQLGKSAQLLISVSDNGVGLPPERADQIFDAFFTTKPQGTGLGLSITRSIVESHSGRVWATANSGRGTTFHFTLPIRTAVSA